MSEFRLPFRLVDTGLIAALATAARKAREEAGVSRTEIAMKVGKTEDTIRLFENGRTFLALNDLLDAYGASTDASLMDLLSDAEAILKKKG
jgi:transcriptional regulator with XRE-family HTH domain